MASTRWTIRMIVVVAGILYLWGTGWAADSITIGVAGPHSGNLSSYGTPTLRAAEQAAEAVNGRGGILGKQVVLLPQDDGCTPEGAVGAAAELVRQHVDAVLGHICSAATWAALDVYRAANIIVISPSATYPALTKSGKFPNFFRTAAPVMAQARLQVELALGPLKSVRVAVLYDRGDYGQRQAEYIKGIVENDPRARLVHEEGVAPGAGDYSGIVARVKESGTEAVIFSGYPPEASKIVRRMRKTGTKTAFIADDGVQSDTFISLAGAYADGVYATGPKDVSGNRMADAAVETYRRTYGAEPGPFFLQAYTAVLALVHAMKTSGSTDADILTQALHAEVFETPFGKLRFDSNGDAVGMGFSVYQVQNGRFVEIRPGTGRQP